MKWIGLFTVATILLSANCNREASVHTFPDEGKETEPITYYPIDRNDIPPPPPGWHENVDTSQFNDCQKMVWRYIGRFYPVAEENELGVDIYTLQEEGNDFMERVAFHGEFVQFFEDTLTKKFLWGERPQCYGQLDTTFFLENIGLPTIRGYAPTSRYGDEPIVTFLYFIKNRDRSGPCPYFFDSDGIVNTHNVEHYMYCRMLKLTFRKNEGFLAEAMYSGL